jgi:hypothetical protein
LENKLLEVLVEGTYRLAKKYCPVGILIQQKTITNA